MSAIALQWDELDELETRDTERPTSIEAMRARWFDEAQEEISRLRRERADTLRELNETRGANEYLHAEIRRLKAIVAAREFNDAESKR